jgi:protein-tyrosine-phosphatase
MKSKKKIMFVCAGNTSRSAMAEIIFRRMMGDKIEVCSSGVIAENGRKSSPKTVNVCRNHGFDITNHRATYFKDSDIADMDLVLTFEQFQSERIKIYYPHLKVCTLRQYVGEYPIDLPDPVGGDEKLYDAYFCEIYRLLKKARVKL